MSVETGCKVCSAEIQQLDPAHLAAFVDGRLTEAIQVLVSTSSISAIMSP